MRLSKARRRRKASGREVTRRTEPSPLERGLDQAVRRQLVLVDEVGPTADESGQPSRLALPSPPPEMRVDSLAQKLVHSGTLPRQGRQEGRAASICGRRRGPRIRPANAGADARGPRIRPANAGADARGPGDGPDVCARTREARAAGVRADPVTGKVLAVAPELPGAPRGSLTTRPESPGLTLGTLASARTSPRASPGVLATEPAMPGNRQGSSRATPQTEASRDRHVRTPGVLSGEATRSSQCRRTLRVGCQGFSQPRRNPRVGARDSRSRAQGGSRAESSSGTMRRSCDSVRIRIDPPTRAGERDSALVSRPLLPLHSPAEAQNADGWTALVIH